MPGSRYSHLSVRVSLYYWRHELPYISILARVYLLRLFSNFLLYIFFFYFVNRLSVPLSFWLQVTGIPPCHARGWPYTQHYDRNLSTGRGEFIEDVLCFAISEFMFPWQVLVLL